MMPPQPNRIVIALTAMKYCLLAAAVTTLFLAWFIFFSSQKARDHFVAFENLTFFDRIPYNMLFGDLEYCGAQCIRNNKCRTFTYDMNDVPQLCRWYEHTPYYYGAELLDILQATVYIKKDQVAPGEQRSDGFFYYLSEAPMTAAKAALYCKQGSEFYFLATHSENSSALTTAKEEYRKLLQKPGDNAYGVMILLHRSAELGIESYSFGKKDFALVTDTVTLEVPVTTPGYALCQGDPVNRMASDV